MSVCLLNIAEKILILINLLIILQFLTTLFILTGKIAKMSMEELMNFFQGSLEKDFGYSDDFVIESLRRCADDLRRAHLDLPQAPTDDAELPSKPFGVFVPPTIEQMIGRQSMVADGDGVDSGVVVIPPDGGPVIVPMRSSIAINHHPSSVSSSSAQYDTATDGLSSRRISVRDGRSSVTSLVDQFLDIEDDINDITAEEEDLQVDSIDVNDDLTDTQQWPWSSSMPYISSTGPTSHVFSTPPSMSPVSDTACVTVGRNTVGMVSLNQPVSLVTVVAGDGDTPTPAVGGRQPSPRFTTKVRSGATSDAGIHDFFAPTTEPWAHYVRASPYPSVALSPDRRPTNTQYHLYALKSAKDLSRQRYFSSGRVDSRSDASYRYRPNGFSMQVAHQHQPGAVSAPTISNIWPENNGWSLPSSSRPDRNNTDIISSEQPVINVHSRVMSPSGNEVGSKLIFIGGDASARSHFMSPVSQPLPDSPANWVYRL